jgi:hypothetical protein
MGFFKPPLYQALLPILQLGLEQCLKEAKMGTTFANRLLGELRALRRDRGQVQQLALLADTGSF